MTTQMEMMERRIHGVQEPKKAGNGRRRYPDVENPAHRVNKVRKHLIMAISNLRWASEYFPESRRMANAIRLAESAYDQARRFDADEGTD